MYPGTNYGLLRGISLSGILDGTTKTLNIINQIIPIVNQVKPLVSNAQTLFKISNIMNSDPVSDKTSSNNDTKVSSIFFV